MSKRRIKKVAIMGSGIMGSGIACHFANIGEALDYFGISFLTYFDEKMKGGEPVDVVSRIIDAETTYREAA